MRVIAIEEHFVTPTFVSGLGKASAERMRQAPGGGKLFDRLMNIGDARIAEMDAAGIDMQVLSLNSPGVEQADASEAIACARDANDYLAAAIKAHPTRLAGFASLPIQSPDQAVIELKRCVLELGFKGANVNGHARGRYLDDPYFSPVLACAESLSVPIYLHPTLPPEPVINALYGGFPPAISSVFAGKAWGWHIETATHVLRLVLGGVFDRYPALQVVIGHLGEGIPFMIERLNRSFPVQMTKLRRPVADYLRQNLHYTFGGFNFMPTFLNVLLEVGVQRIMFSADYPYGTMEEGRSFLNNLPVSASDRQCIAHGNAETLLNLPSATG
ncbi:amidohydrolase [Bradyrhizobium sp. CCBAU 53340]|uniref:amidohydrolase family protein n=1 Tax=Bradyrhizobium sp. CCBAU 53340 TaxID=1325112 RepID=UPI00188AA74B|nr:amidohydrolase family protein [Bradyrhizobium sp. CCBAU 53340]QOZ44728.1 amidohydrolase [Bradyrhizobium sp. CCBAU 53340]